MISAVSGVSAVAVVLTGINVPEVPVVARVSASRLLLVYPNLLSP